MRRSGQLLENEIDWERKAVLVWSRSKFIEGRRFDRFDWHAQVIFTKTKFDRVAAQLGSHSDWYYEIINIPVKLKSDVLPGKN